MLNFSMHVWPVVGALAVGALGFGLSGCSSVPSGVAHSDVWRSVPLPGKVPTSYSVARHPSGVWAWHAEALESASMWRHPISVAPDELGRLRFSWFVDELLPGADVSVAGQTDSPVRIVLGFDGDLGKLTTKQRMLFELAASLTGEMPPYAMMIYTWDNTLPVDSVVIHPRLDRIRKLILESGPGQLGKWLHYERDVSADFQRLFGESPGPLRWVALMTDSDNVQGKASAWYGEISLGSGVILTPR